MSLVPSIKKLYVNKWSRESLTFVFYLGIVLFFCRDLVYFSSMDGPAHFHNSLLLKEYFLGNETVRQHFVLCPYYIPNLFSTYYISFFLLFFPFKIAIVIFFVTYYFLFLYSTRFLLRSFNVYYPGFCAAIMVVLFNAVLLHFGFYNFCWSVIFLFYSIGIYRNRFATLNTARFRDYALLFVMFFLLYYSTALTFTFFLIYLFFAELARTIAVLRQNRDMFKPLAIHLGKVAVCVLPLLILFLLFYLETPLQGNPQPNDFKQWTENLKMASTVIIYSVPDESAYSRYVFRIICAGIIYIVVQRIILKRLAAACDIFLIMALVMLVLYYVVPDGSNVGMMSPRMQHFFYLFLLLWLVTQKDRVGPVIITLALGIISFKIFEEKRMPALRRMDEEAARIASVEKYIRPNKCVLPLNYTGNWLTPHLSNYIGVNKPLILLDNYQASIGWFPLRWNLEEIPGYTFAGEIQVGGAKANEQLNTKGKKAGYVFVFGDLGKLTENKAYCDELKSNYRMVYTDSTFIQLFCLKEL